MDSYKVRKIHEPVDILAEVPGSKSITNRALLLAAMADGKSVLRGVQFSADSVHFLKALQELGFETDVDEEECVVTITGCGGRIPAKRATINVGSAGTAARFLTAFVAMGDGEYTIEASEQMKKRPMRELLVALEEMGATLTWMEDEYNFPMIVKGSEYTDECIDIKLNIDRSSQFLSALLLVAPVRYKTLSVQMTGNRSARSYVNMTEQMMKQFGHPGVQRLENDTYQVQSGYYEARDYDIEPDVSAACYFYAMAAVTGGKAVVKRMRRDSLQGDMKFISLLERMGCTLRWCEITDNDNMGVGDSKLCLQLEGPDEGLLKGIEVELSDFSDQTLTLAAIAPFADSPVIIRGVAHIRGQESDRINVIVTELGRMGIRCEELEDGVKIYPGQPRAARIETYGDHRVAMSFTVTGFRTDGIEILDPECCSKTFAGYFDEVDRVV